MDSDGVLQRKGREAMEGGGGEHRCISVRKRVGEGSYLLRAYLAGEVTKTKRNESSASTYVECAALDCSVSLEYRTLRRRVKMRGRALGGAE
jgi:hypothetical protein